MESPVDAVDPTGEPLDPVGEPVGGPVGQAVGAGGPGGPLDGPAGAPVAALLRGLTDPGRPAAGALAVVTGSSGTGKTALLDAAARRARAAGAAVLAATASPAEQELPLGVLGQLLGGAALPELPGDARASAFEEGFRRLRDRAAREPVLVTVDDVQYADEPSARALLYLAGRLGPHRLLLLVAGQRWTRTAPPPALAQLLRHPAAHRTALTTLTPEQTAGLLAGPGALGADAARRLAPAWHRVTGGNPRLLRALLEDHAACAPLRPARPVVGTAVKRAVGRCLRAAGPAAAEAARALAVLGDGATLALVGGLLGTHDRAAVPALAELDAMGLLASGRLRHEGVRAAVLEELAPDDCARLHERAARLLHEDGAPPAAVARHLAAAHAAAPDAPAARPPWAVPVLAEAAGAALRAGDPWRAAELLRTAHRSGPDARHSDAVLVDLACAEWETDPGSVTRHLPALAHALERGRLDPRQALAAAGPLLWHGRPEAPAAAATALRALTGRIWPRPDGVHADGAPVSGTGGPWADGAGSAAAVTGTPERVLRALALGHAPRPAVAELLGALLHTWRLPRPRAWSALLAEGAAWTQGSPARRAVLEAAAAVLYQRTGEHRAASRHAASALELVDPAAWGVAAGVPLAVAVDAATARAAHGEAAELLRVPVPEEMFRTTAGLPYLLARGRHQLAAGRAAAARDDFHTCRDLMAGWGLEPAGALDWRTGPADASRPGEDGRGAVVPLTGGRDATGPAGSRSGHSFAEKGSSLAVLSRAERRVVGLVAEGCTNRVVAARLFVTPSTVEQHLTRVYRKLGVRSRADLTALWRAAAADGDAAAREDRGAVVGE
ncbi:LuxR C-terminal-related transcriptional regulator [Streptomyces sp. NPDC090056]|uniref:helix-turn-helix transcriptional regulator n=1 Tax=Streptomyces sp. NPDC090056 TaxID=3365934 RepID=UPI003818A2A4